MLVMFDGGSRWGMKLRPSRRTTDARSHALASIPGSQHPHRMSFVHANRKFMNASRLVTTIRSAAPQARGSSPTRFHIFLARCRRSRLPVDAHAARDVVERAARTRDRIAVVDLA